MIATTTNTGGNQTRTRLSQISFLVFEISTLLASSRPGADLSVSRGALGERRWRH
jgi:hypothetical protein